MYSSSVCEQPTIVTGSITTYYQHDDPSQSISAALSSEVKRTGREANYLPPSSDEVNNHWIYIHVWSPGVRILDRANWTAKESLNNLQYSDYSKNFKLQN
jgi:hypothetical protein